LSVQDGSCEWSTLLIAVHAGGPVFGAGGNYRGCSMKAHGRRSNNGRRIGYGEVNDAGRLAQDPAFRLMGSESAFQGSPKRGDEPRRKNKLERLSWRQPGVYS
jgi:hypothetical protein